MTFRLHDDLARSCVEICRFSLCRVLLNNDSNYPWLILVPERADVSEIHDLSPSDRATLIEEIAAASSAMAGEFNADKMNVAALGNATPQLHIHIVARFKNDRAGLGPVWNAVPPAPYAAADLDAMVNRLRDVLA